ncbi:MAG: thioredoxin family protein [Planctomycetes bacterium]|jgi:thioredoxin-related protein|nr:thioredoxin family protein [Planctomycetota bacterium]MBT6453306.1 thioredoxin family protein [Planctomycetota bacterium]MBT6541534.1 thioredoxin family protein [Planctomycetota bacterium]MBT6784639.1 thioredoxin family protein [Planctomycetota bacterium]MBT6969443.1 thioredoxin family protein [Planctomycetota bacterium]
MDIRIQLLVLFVALWIPICGSSLCSSQFPLLGAQEADSPGPEAKAADVYDEKANATDDIAAAVARAAKNHKRVLVVYGGNWCGWCVKLDEFFKKDRAVAKTLYYEYEVVKVDIGKFDKNMELVEKYGAQLKKDGVPYLTVLDDKGKAITNQNTGDLEEGDHHDRAKIEAFLKAQKLPPVDAEKALAKALKQASKDGRKVLLHLGAPW